EVVAAMERMLPIGPSISIDGGMSANPAFCQMLADITGRVVAASHQKELTAAGIAGLMDVALKPVPTSAFAPERFDAARRQALAARYAEAVRRACAWRSS